MFLSKISFPSVPLNIWQAGTFLPQLISSFLRAPLKIEFSLNPDKQTTARLVEVRGRLVLSGVLVSSTGDSAN